MESDLRGRTEAIPAGEFVRKWEKGILDDAEALLAFARTQGLDEDAFRHPQGELRVRAQAFVERVVTFLDGRHR